MENCLEKIIDKIINYLIENYDNNGFAGRSFYGEAFFAAALTMYNKTKYSEDIKKLIKVADKKSEKLNSTLHWEFNNYAIMQIIRDYPEYKAILSHEFYYGSTKSTNWIFLRQLCKCLNSEVQFSREFKTALWERQQNSGLILDAKNVSSLQYHCFSTVLLYEIYEVTNDKRIYNAFIKAVNFIKQFTLRDGESLYIGRGQEQIFGYGCLIYLYELAYIETKDIEYINLQSKCLEYIKDYSNDKMIPLVINKYESISEKNLDVNSIEHLGWYSYNNYYDYLPFFCYFITKTLKLKKADNKAEDYILGEYKEENKVYIDTHFMRYSNNNYDAVVSCYPGADANYIMLPYIVSESGNVTPCYGGEKAHNCILYSDAAIPVPYFKFNNIFAGCMLSNTYLMRFVKSMKNRTVFNKEYYIWQNMNFIIRKDDEQVVIEANNSFCHYRRRMRFGENSVDIQDSLKIKRNIKCSNFVPLNLAFYMCKLIHEGLYDIGNGWRLLIQLEDASNLYIQKKGFCAKGELTCLEQNYGKIELEKGKIYTYKYKIFTS